jgi:hypothetical protein
MNETGILIFLRSQDADNARILRPKADELVTRGLTKKYLSFILKSCEKAHNAFVLILPNLGGDKVLSLPLTPSEVTYYINHNHFISKKHQEALDKTLEIVNNPPKVNQDTKLKIDPLLKELENIYNKSPRKYPGFIELLKKYRQYIISDLEKTEDTKKENLSDSEEEFSCYEQLFYINKFCYKIIWSISNANEIIKKYNIPKKEYKIDELLPLVTESNIVKSHLEKAIDNDKPIIIASCPATTAGICVIDGNHRVISKYNNKQNTIEGYLLEPEQHIAAMLLDIHRILYKIHNNIFEILKYMNNEIELEDLKLLPINTNL